MAPAAVGVGVTPQNTPIQLDNVRATLGGIGSSVGSFFGSRVASFRAVSGTGPGAGVGGEEVAGQKKGLRPMSLSPSANIGTGKR